SSEAWYNKGVALRKCGDLAHGLTCYERSLECKRMAGENTGIVPIRPSDD
ncbi:MAG: tetratricopeptide repeat protein, partial [Rubrobacteridae bacterium]|nr:tetratricopeptide repeat protein [Rubrobacteridae bacterium]